MAKRCLGDGESGVIVLWWRHNALRHAVDLNHGCDGVLRQRLSNVKGAPLRQPIARTTVPSIHEPRLYEAALLSFGEYTYTCAVMRSSESALQPRRLAYMQSTGQIDSLRITRKRYAIQHDISESVSIVFVCTCSRQQDSVSSSRCQSCWQHCSLVCALWQLSLQYRFPCCFLYNQVHTIS